jgi:lipoprotein-anchoring transpeptidase ErfK/SrfK
MFFRDIVIAGICSAFLFSTPALAEGDGPDLRELFQRKVELDQARQKAAAKPERAERNTRKADPKADSRAAKRKADERKTAERTRTERTTSVRAMPVSVAPTVDVASQGNNGELRSSNQPQSGFFKTIFGEDAPQYLPETRALDGVLAQRASAKPFQVKPEHQPQSVAFSGYPRGTIVVDTAKRFLYLVEGRDTARRYAIAVGKEGLAFKGTATVGDKQEWPRWFPTKDMQEREPKKYGPYKDGMNGGPDNPLGARAIYLYQGNKDTHIRIHGTNQPQTIGSASSNGCFRMINDHVMDLYNRVPMGAQVVVL